LREAVIVSGVRTAGGKAPRGTLRDTRPEFLGKPESVPAVTVNRFCSLGLQAIAFGAEGIMTGRCDVVLAGGIEHMSLVPMGGIIRPNPEIAEDKQLGNVFTPMGQTAENVATRYNVSRED